MVILDATDMMKRRPTAKIAEKAWGNADYSPRKNTIADLVRWGFAESQTGSGGGVWITPKGVRQLNQKIKRKQ